MHQIAVRKKHKFFAAHLGQTVDVLFESVDDDGYRKGFTGSYLRVGIAADSVSENQITTVSIEDIESDFCVAARPAVPVAKPWKGE
jgi:tRNA A37 methylthiotransferase MiaB